MPEVWSETNIGGMGDTLQATARRAVGWVVTQPVCAWLASQERSDR